MLNVIYTFNIGNNIQNIYSMFKTHKVFELYRKIAIVDIREIKKKKNSCSTIKKIIWKAKKKNCIFNRKKNSVSENCDNK